MIPLTRLNDKVFFLNEDYFEIVESTPDTIVTLADGKKYVVKEKPQEIQRLIMKNRAMVMAEKENLIRNGFCIGEGEDG
jgi:flagellar protein FlbD